MSQIAIHVCELEKRYRVWTHAPPTNLKERMTVAASAFGARLHLAGQAQFRQEVHALRGVSFDVKRGEVLGVIGRNGAGKSTLLSILARITEPTAGYAELRGHTSSLLEVGTGFHPELSGRDNVFLNGAILGMTRAETARKFDEIVEFSGVREFIDIPVKRYSSGMQVRLAFAVAAHLDPEILLLDEVLAVGDAQFQARCHARVRELTTSGRTVLFVSHDVTSVARICDRAIMLENGIVTYEGPAAETAERYLAQSRHETAAAPARSGTGAWRVRRVTVQGSEGVGQARSGGAATFTVELHQPISAGDAVTLRLDLKTSDGAVLVALETELVDTTALQFECTVESLPLRQGTYLVSSTVERIGQIVDQVDVIAEFSVLPRAGAAGGARPAAPVLVEQSWSARPAFDEIRGDGLLRQSGTAV
jgi:lipopolysaccharide transport system ATP-binding protein